MARRLTVAKSFLHPVCAEVADFCQKAARKLKRSRYWIARATDLHINTVRAVLLLLNAPTLDTAARMLEAFGFKLIIVPIERRRRRRRRRRLRRHQS